MKKQKISVIIKEPGKKPRHVRISNTLGNLQRTVGGYIETVTLASDLVVICDEEGRFKDYEHCCTICGVEFVGTIILCGIDGEDFGDCPIAYDKLKRLMPDLWNDSIDARNA